MHSRALALCAVLDLLWAAAALGASTSAAKTAKLDRLVTEPYNLGRDDADVARIRSRLPHTDGVRSKAVRADLGRDRPEASPSVWVKRKQGGRWVVQAYDRTRRGIASYKPYLNLERKRGKRILELGAGYGVFVTEARARGFQVDGIDIVLSPEQKTHRYFIEADAAQTGLPARRYHEIVSFASLFSYEGDNRPLMLRALAEAWRLLKPGGHLTLIEGYPAELIRQLHGFKRVRGGDGNFIVLKKISRRVGA